MSVNHMVNRIRPGANGEAKLRCPVCQQRIRVNVSSLPDIHCPVTVDCECGNRFSIVIDTTRLLRKPTRLMGLYTKFQKIGSDETGFIDVEELSIAGITFRTRTSHMIRVGDILRIRFAVDHAVKAEISKSIMVKQVLEQSVSGEFCEKTSHDPALALYLQSSEDAHSQK